MRGKPKYKENDEVIVTLDGKVYEGIIYTVDKYGAWDLIDNNGEPSYDILIKHYSYNVASRDPITGETITEHREDSECLVKHIREVEINGKKKKGRKSSGANNS